MGSGLPRDVLRGSRTPPGLGTEGTLELEEGRPGWLDHRVWVKASFPGQRLFQGRSDTTEAQCYPPPGGRKEESLPGLGGLPHPSPASHRAAVSVPQARKAKDADNIQVLGPEKPGS